MTGINQGTPETAIGEPIRLGDSNEFEIEQHPISDRLIIRDTVNGKVAYVRKERGGSIGGDGVLIKALKEGKPMADDGRTYDTIQQAERAASSWVFVPPGTFNENVVITTDGLTLRGSGYNTLIDGGATSEAVTSNADNVTISKIRMSTDSGSGVTCFTQRTDGSTVRDVTISNSGNIAFETKNSTNTTFVNCTVESCDGAVHSGITPESLIFNGITVISASDTFIMTGPNVILANSIIRNVSSDAVQVRGGDSIVIGNRIIGASNDGIDNNRNNVIIANNRISDSGGSDINDSGTGTLLDANLTGASN